MGIAPPALVVGAARSPLPFGLFSAFSTRPAGDRWQSGVQWETGTCDPVDGIGAAACGDPQVQVVTVAGGASSGTWTLTFGDNTSGELGVGATLAEVQAAVDAVLGAGVAVVTGETGGPFTVTWVTGGTVRGSLSVDIVDPFDQGTIGILYTPGSDEQQAVGLPKSLDSNTGDVGQATEFTVYGHFQCSPVGWSVDAAQNMATAHLIAREEARVEQALWTGDLGNVPNFTGATVLGGGAVQMPWALALLENWVATTYGSLGVIHMTRGDATVFASEDLVLVSGGRLTTVLGTPVVAGAGYPGTGPSGGAPNMMASQRSPEPLSIPDPNSHAWIYATPALFGYRSEVFTSSNRPGDLFDRAQNDLYAVAERTYLLGFDPCGVAAVEVIFPEPVTLPV